MGAFERKARAHPGWSWSFRTKMPVWRWQALSRPDEKQDPQATEYLGCFEDHYEPNRRCGTRMDQVSSPLECPRICASFEFVTFAFACPRRDVVECWCCDALSLERVQLPDPQCEGGSGAEH